MKRRADQRARAVRRSVTASMVLFAVSLGGGVALAQESVHQDDAKDAADVGAPIGDRYVANGPEIAEAADWDEARTITIVMTASALTPNEIALETGRPYVIELFNVTDRARVVTASDFLRSVATLRGETTESYLRVPYLTELEVFPGATVRLSVVAVVPGTYQLLAQAPDAASAASAGITVTSLPQPVLADVATAPWIQEGPALAAAVDWDGAEQLTVELSEFAFEPRHLDLVGGRPYEITVLNIGVATHEFTAPEFFRRVAFGGAVDGSAGFRAPAPSELEVTAGSSAKLFLVPLVPGEYELVCEIDGHYEAGMHGTISVSTGS